jgi:hypothetical protein
MTMIPESVRKIEGCARVWRNQANQYHRIDGPAIEWVDNSTEWFVMGLRHRIDGPAVEWANNVEEWWVNGKQLTQAEIDDLKKQAHVEQQKFEAWLAAGCPLIRDCTTWRIRIQAPRR